MTALTDILYLFTLMCCIGIGNTYKQIKDSSEKCCYGVGMGFLCAFVISGRGIIHSMLMVSGNFIIINYCSIRVIRRLSLFFTWTYLVLLHLYFNRPRNEMCLYQIMALRLVGLASEVRLSYMNIPTTTFSKNYDTVIVRPSAIDVMNYAYFFVGLHNGPYYTWKVFKEHFTYPVGFLGDCHIITEQKLKKILVCALVYIALRAKHSPDVYQSDSFYVNQGSDYRFIYNTPMLILFLLKHQIFMLLGTSVFTECRFGLYPAICQSKPGFGPTTQHKLLQIDNKESKDVSNLDFSFAMLKCLDHHKLIFGPRMSDTIKGWDMPTRFWFSEYITNSLFSTFTRIGRTIITLILWTIWIGPTLQNFILATTVCLYLQLEKNCSVFYDVNGLMHLQWSLGCSLMRILCLLYITPCLVVEDQQAVLRYYNSIYWSFHILILTIQSCNLFMKRLRGRHATMQIATRHNSSDSMF